MRVVPCGLSEERRSFLPLVDIGYVRAQGPPLEALYLDDRLRKEMESFSLEGFWDWPRKKCTSILPVFPTGLESVT